MTFVFAFLQHLKTNNRKNTIFFIWQKRRRDNRQNDTQHKDTRHNDIEPTDTLYNDIQLNIKIIGRTHNNENETLYYAEWRN